MADSRPGDLRQVLLTQVEERVNRFAETHDAEVVLASAAVDEAQRLLDVVGWGPDADVDAEAVLAVAWFYWFRANAREAAGEDEEADVTTAVELFTPLHAVDPGLLPPVLRELLNVDDLPASEPGVLRYREFRQSRDPAVLDDAVRLLRETAGSTTDDDIVLPRRLSNLAAALRERHLLTHQFRDCLLYTSDAADE